MAIDYAHAYQTFIDQELAAASATEWMAATGGQIRFSGGKEVEISTLTTTGLGRGTATVERFPVFRIPHNLRLLFWLLLFYSAF